MARRRGEVPFVAIRVGRSSDPREVDGLARELKVSKPAALGMVALWEEFILEVGDAMTGRVRGYNANHLAAKVCFDGQPRRLVEAFKNAGLLKTQRGVFFHPYWLESITGQYAHDRATQRETWAKNKREQREREAQARAAAAGGAPQGGGPGSGADVRQVSSGQRVDVPTVSSETADMEEGRNGIPGASPPPSPPPGGGSGEARWGWLLKNAERPTKPEACAALAAKLSDEDWALVQWVCQLAKDPAPNKYRGKKRVLRMDTWKLLQERAYLQFLPEWRQKQAPPPPTVTAAPEELGEAIKAKEEARRAREEAERKQARVRDLLLWLSDPDVPEAKKAKERERWLKEFPNERPWEDPPKG